MVKYELTAKGYVFAGSGKTIVSPGWRSISKSDDKEDEVKEVPMLVKGDIIPIPIYIIDTKKSRLNSLINSYVLKNPKNMYEIKSQKLDNLVDKLNIYIKRNINESAS